MLALGVVASSQALLIDDFSSGFYDSGPVTSSTIAWQNAGSVAGGVRGTLVGFAANPLGEDSRLRITTGQMAIASSGVLADNLFQLAYGFAVGSTSVGSNPLNLNLSASPIFEADFRFNDIPQTLNVYLFSNNGAQSGTFSTTVAGGINSTTTISVNASAFGGNLADVDAIVFEFDTAPGGDFAISNLRAVPEPATLAVLGLGAAALIRRRRVS